MSKLNLGVALALAACSSETKPEYVGDPPFCYIDCPFAECTKVFEFDGTELAALQACFGDDFTGVWDASTPVDLIANCPDATELDTGVAGCLISYGPFEGYSEPLCGCGQCTPNAEVPEDCCADPVEAQPVEWAAAGAGMVDAAFNACAITLTPEERCDPLDEVAWGAECPVEAQISAPNADYNLQIDPLVSFLEVHASGDSDIVALEGSGAAATGPARFLIAVVWADDGELAGHDYTDWIFWLDTPVEIDLVSGEYDLYATDDPDIYGTGLRDEVGKAYQFHLTNDASGIFNTTNGTWELDYSEVSDRPRWTSTSRARSSPSDA
jgi:hypothetical protein